MNDQKKQMRDTVSGVLIIDKPTGMTSHDVVQVVRRGTNIRRAGHTGTLDPRASGVLIVLIGPAVRLSEYISAEDKRYQAMIHLGERTDTYDGDGTTTGTLPVEVTRTQLEEALQGFVGEIKQVPPPHSAIKIRGHRAYELARKGEKVELEPRIIKVHSLELVEWNPPDAVIDVHCSSGTYVRSLANDLGEKLGCGGMLTGLIRMKSGRFSLRDSIPLRKLKEAFEDGTWYKYLIPAAEALADWPSIILNPEEVEAVRHGHRIHGEGEAGVMVRAITEQGELVALMDFDTETEEFQPRKVFFT
ncbi:MAG TPA: tRNA pseudouridine(55) synthase TruB [Anaerolineae bacterium]|nr:tRNA pseudouridine(55) synthase TruB [Anaerolineae bacterium]